MKQLAIAIVKLYRILLSPLFPGSCRFFPSCSQYAIDALTKHGVVRGAGLTLKRLSKCHPFHPGGYDPA